MDRHYDKEEQAVLNNIARSIELYARKACLPHKDKFTVECIPVATAAACVFGLLTAHNATLHASRMNGRMTDEEVMEQTVAWARGCMSTIANSCRRSGINFVFVDDVKFVMSPSTETRQ